MERQPEASRAGGAADPKTPFEANFAANRPGDSGNADIRDVLIAAVRGQADKAKVRSRLRIKSISDVSVRGVRVSVELVSGTIVSEVVDGRWVDEPRPDHTSKLVWKETVTEPIVPAQGATAAGLGIIEPRLDFDLANWLWQDELSAARVMTDASWATSTAIKNIEADAVERAVRDHMKALFSNPRNIRWSGVRYKSSRAVPVELTLIEVHYEYEKKPCIGYIEPVSGTYLAKPPVDSSQRVASFWISAIIVAALVVGGAGYAMNQASQKRGMARQVEAESQAANTLTSSPSTRPAGGYLTVTNVRDDDYLNVRDAPMPTAEIVGQLKPGERVNWTGRTSNVNGQTWYEVSANGGLGWANASYLSPRATERAKPRDIDVPLSADTQAFNSLDAVDTGALTSELEEVDFRSVNFDVVTTWKSLHSTFSVEQFQALADTGNVKAAALLGYAYMNKLGVSHNYTKAGNLFEVACDGGDMASCNRLGTLVHDGRGAIQDISKTEMLFRKACEASVMNACSNLGSLYEEGKGVTRDYSEANRLYQLACDGGAMIGCSNLGSLHENALGTKQDYSEARKLYQASCDGGEMMGCNNLGALYHNGRGVRQDFVRARDLYKRACYGGEQLACGNLNGLPMGGR